MNEIADSQPPANDSDQNRTVNPTKADGKRTPFTSSAPISQRHLEQIELLDRKISAALRLVRPTATPHTAPQRRSKPKPWGPRNSAKGPAKRSARAPHSDTNSGQISTKSSDYARVDLEIVGTRPSRAYRGKPSAAENSSKQDPSSTIADNRGSYDTLVGDKQDRNLWLRQATSTLNTKQGSAVSTSTSDVTTAATTKSIEHEGTLTEGTMQVAPPLTSPVKSSREVSARWDQHARQTPMASPLENAERSKVTSPASSSHNTPATNPSPTVGSGREAVSSSKQRASYQRSEAPFLSDLDLDKEADRLLHEYEQSLRAVGLGLELEEAESKSPVSSEDSFLSLSRGASRFGPVTEQSHGSFQRDGVVRDDEGVDDLGLEKSDNIVARLKSRLDNVFEAEVHRESSPGFSVGNTSMDKLTEVPKQLETSMDPLRDSIFGANRDSQDSLRLSDSMRLSASVESNGFDTHSEASPTKSTGETDPSATAIGTNNKSNDTLAHSEDDITSNVVERIDAQASSEVRPVDASTPDHGVDFGCDGAESEDVNVASCGGSPSSVTDTSLDESAERILSRIEDQHAELLHGDTASVDSDSDSDNDAPILTGASPSTQQAPLLSENGITDSTFDGVAQNSSNTERNLAADAATRSAPPPPLQQFSMFERVECRYGGGETYYPGSISAVNEDGTYNIGYDDGDAESNVDGSLIRGVAAADGSSNAVEAEADTATTSEQPPPRQQFTVFERVECRYGGGETYYPGSISAVNEDGTYNIGYDDGDAESNVDGSLIRRIVALGPAAPVASDTSMSASQDTANLSALPFAEDSPMWRQVAFTIFRLFDPDQTGIWTVAQINAHQKATASDGEPAEQFSDASSMSSTFRELGFRVEGTGENRGLPFQSVWKLYQMHGEMLLDYVCVFARVVIVVVSFVGMDQLRSDAQALHITQEKLCDEPAEADKTSRHAVPSKHSDGGQLQQHLASVLSNRCRNHIVVDSNDADNVPIQMADM